MVSLGNVDNTSDINKYIPTATPAGLNLKSNIASPSFRSTSTTLVLAVRYTYNWVRASTVIDDYRTS